MLKANEKIYEFMSVPRHDGMIVSIMKNGDGIGSIALFGEDTDLEDLVTEFIDACNFRREKQSSNRSKEQTVTVGPVTRNADTRGTNS